MKIEKRVVVCMCIAFVSAFFLTGWLLAQRGLLVDAKAQETQENLAQEVLRFHVLANSDSGEEDAGERSGAFLFGRIHAPGSGD